MTSSPVDVNVSLLQNDLFQLTKFFNEELTVINRWMRYDLGLHILLAVLYITYAVIYVELPTKIKSDEYAHGEFTYDDKKYWVPQKMVTNKTKKYTSMGIYLFIGVCYFAIGYIIWKEFNHVKYNWKKIKFKSMELK